MNSITADELKHISISLPQTKWKEEKQALRDKKKGQYLIDQYKRRN
jgi:hypothetical protein